MSKPDERYEDPAFLMDVPFDLPEHLNGKEREILEARVKAKLKRKIQTGRLSKKKREKLRKTLSESTKIVLEDLEEE